MKPINTPLFAYNIISFNTNYNLSFFIKELYSIKSHYPEGVTKSNAGGYQTKDNLHNNPTFSPVNNTITKLISEGLNTSCKILEMWGNISPKYTYNHIHDHIPNLSSTDKLLSGVVYLKTNNKSGNITFHNPVKLGNLHSFTPYNNLMLLFPSNLPHSVEQNLSDEDRISISFNIQIL